MRRNKPAELHYCLLALKYKSYSNKPLDLCLNWAYKNYQRFIEYKHSKPPVLKREPWKYLEKEFRFRGFVPKDEFECKTKYFYIKPTVGNLIYPEAFHTRYSCQFSKKIKATKREVWEVFTNIGIAGYTSIEEDYHRIWRDRYMDRKIKRLQRKRY